MSEPTPKFIESFPASASDGFFLNRGQELRKQTIPLLNDVLGKLIVLNTALIGVFVGLKEVPVPAVLRILTILSFIVSLSFALYGIYPREWRVLLDSPEDIREKEDQGIAVKSSYLKSAGIALVVGFSVAFVGFIISSVWTSEPTPYIPLAE